MSSFDEYYKKWKKDNDITEEIAYNPNMTFEEQARGAVEANQRFNQLRAKREQERQAIRQPVQTTQTNLPIKNNLGYIAKSTGVGLLGGITGLGQALLTDAANNMRQGKNQKILPNIANLITGSNIAANIPAAIMNSAKSNIDTLKDKDKTAWEKIVALELNAVSNAKQIMPLNQQMSAAQRIAGRVNPTADETALKLNEKISAPVNKLNEELQQESQNHGGITNFVASGGRIIGNMVPSIAATAITKDPSIGLGVMGVSAKGQSTNEALSQGQSLENAVKIGDAKALIEVATERLSGGVGKVFGKGSLDDVAEDFIRNGVKSKFGKFLAKQGYNIAGETVEEWISNIADNFIDKGTVDQNRKIFDLKEGLETLGQTAFTTALLGGMTGQMRDEYRQAKADVQAEQQAQIYLNEAQKIIKQENLTEKLKNDIADTAIQRAEGIENNQSNQPVLPTQQTVQTAPQVTTSDDLISSARKYNLKYQDSNLNQVQNVFKNKGIDSRFDASKFTDNKTGAMWQLTRDQDGNVRREIILNPNADEKTVIQEMAIHELTHDIVAKNTDTSTKLYNEVRDWLARDSEYQNQLDQLKSVYGDNVVEEEAIAKTLQTKFGNQENIDNLVNYNPSMARRIYDWVVDKLNKITGGRIEKLYWEDVKNKFEKAYSEQGNYKQEATRLSTQTTTDNQGRTLSKQQQEYFKDSKILDRNGLLMTVYHGTGENFNVFDINNISKNTKNAGFFGDGFYFTPIKESARSYGKNIKEVYLDIKNPFSFSELSKYNGQDYYTDYIQIANLVNLNKEWGKIPVKFNSEQTWQNISDDVQNMLKNNNTDEEIDNAMYDKYGEIPEKLNDRIYNYSKQNNWKTLRKVLIENGYDGIINSDTAANSSEIIAFYANQIKNIDNTNPTDNPDIRYSDNANFDEYIQNRVGKQGTRTTLGDLKLPVQQQTQLNNLTDAEAPKQKLPTKTGNTDEKIAEVLDKPFKEQKPKQRTWAIIKANLVDKGAVFEDLSRKTNNRELQAKWDATLSSGAKGQYAIGQDRYEFKNGKQNKISKSLESIISEVGENEADFQNYMYHQLNVDRMTLDQRYGIDNKPVFGDSIDAEYSRRKIADLEQEHPEFKEYAQDVYDFLNANKQAMVDSGIISQELSDELAKRYPHYVPIQRIGVEGAAINVPLDTKRTGVNAPLKRAKGGSQDIQPLFNTIADRTLQTYRAGARNSFGVELKNSLQQLNLLNQSAENIDIDNVLDSVATDDTELLKKGEKGKNPTFTVFENGNKVTYDINDDMYDALKPKNELLRKLDDSKLSKAVRKFGDFRRGLLTEYNPIFSITNSLKDAQDVLMNSQHATKTYKKLPEAYSQILGKGYYYQEYLQNGGEQNSYFNEGDFKIKEKGNKLDKLKMPLEMISKVNNVIEMAPRLAEYIASRESGRSVETSMLDAARVTTNFKAGGDVTKFANRNGATFLNASVQGLAQNIRNIQEAHQKGFKGYAVLAGKLAVAGLPAMILNHLVWRDDEDYEELQDYVKDNYYIIGKYGDGQFIRIPKGRTVAVVQKIVNNIDDFITNDKLDADKYASQFWKDLKEDIKFGADNLAPNNPIDNNIISPIIQAATNKTWYGEDLVPTRLQDKPKAEQYDESTDKFSRWLGEKTGISPVKINYLLDQYTGGVGDILLPMGTPQAENNAIEDKFTTNSVMKSRYPGEFFEKFDELNVQNNSEKATDEDKLKYKYFSGVRSQTSDLYKQKREIQNSNKSDAEKKKELLEVQKQINKITKDALEGLDKVKVSGNTATVGNQEYYKYKDTWTKLTDKEKIEGVSLKDYATFRNITEGLTKESEKVQALVKSNISDSNKAKIYKNTIGKDDKYFDTAEKAKININNYLNYKANIGTTKASAVEYLDKSNIDYEQKLLLLGTKYALSSQEKSTLAKYINNLSITKSDKLDIYQQLKGFNVNGDKVSW